MIWEMLKFAMLVRSWINKSRKRWEIFNALISIQCFGVCNIENVISELKTIELKNL